MEKLLEYERIHNDIYQDKLKKMERTLIKSELKTSSLLNKNYNLLKLNSKLKSNNTRLSNDIIAMEREMTYLKEKLRESKSEFIKIDLVDEKFKRYSFNVNRFDFIYEILQKNSFDNPGMELFFQNEKLNIHKRYFDYGLRENDIIYIKNSKECFFDESRVSQIDETTFSSFFS